MNNKTRIKITLTDGKIYTLKEPETLGEIDSSRMALFVFNNGEVYSGQTNGEVDEDGDFCLSRPDKKAHIGLPFNRLLGWAYKKES